MDTRIQEQLEAPMPWIGMYIAAASLVCSLAMAADAFNGFRSKRMWFPCKYFSLSATSLTLLAVSMKFSVDITSTIFTNIDWLVKVSSLIFMTVSTGNFVSSLGCMNDKEMLTNVVALGILVITIVVNVWIQLFQLKPFLPPIFMVSEMLFATVFMLVLLVALVSCAITIPTTKRCVESRYKETQKLDQREEQAIFNIDEQREAAIRHWLMAETGSPQFVIARSAVCTLASAISMVAALTLVEAYVQAISRNEGAISFWEAESVYGWSTKWILLVQSFGVAVGTISPTFRWFLAVSFKCSGNCRKSFKKEFKVESYWIQRLVDWRDSYPSSQIRHHKCRKYLYCAKSMILNFFIGVQIVLVRISRLHVRVSASLMCPLFACFSLVNNSENLFKVWNSNNWNGSELGDGTEIDLSRYVFLLEGEVELPRKTIMNIYHRADKAMQRGEKLQPENLVNLLQNSNDFKGVKDFDSSLIPSLHFQEPPNCWSLPVVTLASIAVSLPNVANDKAKQLVRSVSEGFSLVKLIDNSLDTNGELLNVQNAAATIWLGVELFCKWQDKDLREKSLKGKNSKEVLHELSGKAELIVLDFKKDVNDLLMENPVNWPAKVIAANSMYRISRTICDGFDCETDEALFDRLTVMIADIFAACFSNLARVITGKYHRNAVEEREKSVSEALHLLGKTRRILELLQQHEVPFLDCDRAACIEDWRALFLQDIENPIDQ
ncbi:hypothetical protein ABFS82_09G019100 [Erythranthe guttata]|uniref:DUF4220 domain-containing protein n=1 Tax=Erythranthe guttata TaxID=4155 RepID=A0A022Q6J2_ERYGU|nr:hypothetical protein MIMGU_mgv1a002062mg [Erythranthe guttata]